MSALREPPTLPNPEKGQTVNDALSHDFPEAAALCKRDLQLLLEDDSFFDAFFNTMPQALLFHRQYEAKLHENLAIAQHNESLRPGLDALRNETSTAFQEADELKTRWTYIQDAQTDMVKKFAPATQLNRLRAATSNQENLSESLVSSFMEGLLDEETFVRRFKEIRTVYHKRAASVSKWEDGKVVWRT